MNEEKKYRKMVSVFFHAFWTIFVAACFSLCFAAGYLFSEWIFGVFGYPPKMLERILSGFFGIGFFIIVMMFLKAFMEFYNRKRFGENNRHIRIGGSAFLKETMDAMNRIARGDFNVKVTVAKNDPFSEVAESVNKMARELGSMENLRQDFISNVSHEIQSPLTSISGFAALLKTEDISEDMRTHYIDVIESESRRLSKLSENLLKLSALEYDSVPVSAEEYRLDKQIENIILMLEPQWSAKGLSPVLELNKILFQGDEELMSQVFINLLHNSIKFTPNGGEFGVTLTSSENEIHCNVFDSGIGISKEEQVRIFERFYKADKSRSRKLGGNGLGLPLVKKIVELHGGSVTVKSELGNGADFNISLPIKK